MVTIRLISVMCALLALASCSGMKAYEFSTNQIWDVKVGPKPISSTIGKLSGGWLGPLETRDQNKADPLVAQTTDESFQPAEPPSWDNPDAEEKGTPPLGRLKGRGRECQEVEMTLKVRGTPNTANVVACRQPDGKWILSKPPKSQQS